MPVSQRSVANPNQIITQLLDSVGGRSGLYCFWVMCDKYGLLRLDNDHPFLPFLAVQTSLVGFQCEELLAGYVEAFRLDFLNIAGIGEGGNDGLDLGGRDLQ